jgi:predicted alpha/beta-fold hydrolase
MTQTSGVVPTQAADSGSSLSPYRHSPWLSGFHRMTLAGHYLRFDGKRSMPPVERRNFRTTEDTTVVGLCSWQPDRSAAVLILLHGLAGHADRPYMRATARKAYTAGFQVIRLNVRNCGDTEHLAGTMYHAGLVSDLVSVIDTLRSEHPQRRMHLAGFSMGGNVALRLAGMWGASHPPQVASVVAVSPSVDLSACARALDGSRELSLYRRSFVGRLKATIRRRASLFPGRYDLDVLRGVDGIREFDDRVTAPDCGFGDVTTYYEHASARPLLQDIRLPSLVFHSRDDLLTPIGEDLIQEHHAAPAIQLMLSDRGGHCAFIQRRSPLKRSDAFWAESRLVEFLGRA